MVLRVLNSAKGTMKWRPLGSRCLDVWRNHACWRKIQELTSEFLTSVCRLTQDKFCFGLIFAICIKEIKSTEHMAFRASGSASDTQRSLSKHGVTA